MNELATMLAYKAWANARLHAALGKVPESSLLAAQPIVFGSILHTLNHVYAMDIVWQAHLTGRQHGFTTRHPPTCPPSAELFAAQASMDAWFVGYEAALGPGECDAIVEFEFIGGGAGAMTRTQILAHVVNHATYHRGHVAAMLYAMGVVPPVTDLPVFLRTAPGA